MRIILVFLTILILLSVLAPFALALERTPPGSYLAYRATSVSELRSQVANNKTIQVRYASHFGIPAAKLDSTLLSKLTLISLKKPLRAQSWYISKSGKTLVKAKLLPRGAMVFATKDGKPVLAWSCGNPLRTALPTTMVMSSIDTIAPKSGSIETKVLANPIETITTAVVTAPPAPAVVSVLPVETPPVLASIAAPAVAMPPVIIGSRMGLGWLGVLGGVGAVARRSPDRTVVPEPSTFVAIVSLLATVPFTKKRQRR